MQFRRVSNRLVIKCDSSQYAYENKSAIKGELSMSIGTPTTCRYTLFRNVHKYNLGEN